MMCIVVYPQIDERFPETVVQIPWQVTLVCALLALAASRWELGTVVTVLVAVTLFGLAGSRVGYAVGQTVELCVLGYIICRVLRYVFVGAVTANSIFAAVCVYLMIGFLFGQMLCLTGKIQSHSPLRDAEGRAPSIEETFYFSFAALTTTGFGDVKPATPLARSITIVEALTGQLYLVLLLGRLVGLHVSRLKNAEQDTK